MAKTITSTTVYGGSYSGTTFTTSSTATGNTETISNGATDTLSNGSTFKPTGSNTDTYKYIGAAYTGSGATRTYVGFLVQDTTTGTYYLFGENSASTNLVSSSTAYSIDTSVGWKISKDAPACFMAGTMVATPTGEAAVETLKAGDLVTLTDGRTAPISWLGRQTVSTIFADPLRMNPIRIKANALADGVPSRDLLISPDHALLVDGILAQAGALVNGISIVREAEVPETFTYYHVEVADHALILAENTPAETFIDNVDRMNFDNWEEHMAAVGETSIPEMEYPRAKSARQVPIATRARLAARAEGFFTKTNAAAA